jgi:hypothetical protein
MLGEIIPPERFDSEAHVKQAIEMARYSTVPLLFTAALVQGRPEISASKAEEFYTKAATLLLHHNFENFVLDHYAISYCLLISRCKIWDRHTGFSPERRRVADEVEMMKGIRQELRDLLEIEYQADKVHQGLRRHPWLRRLPAPVGGNPNFNIPVVRQWVEAHFTNQRNVQFIEDLGTRAFFR